MEDGLHVDTRDLWEFEKDLREMPQDLMAKAEKVVSKGALNVKNGWKHRWDGHPHIPHLAHRAISYDLATHADVISGVIGPDKDRPQGALGNIIEFGTHNNAPIPGGVPALAEEEPRFVRAVAELGEKVVRRAAR